MVLHAMFRGEEIERKTTIFKKLLKSLDTVAKEKAEDEKNDLHS